MFDEDDVAPCRLLLFRVGEGRFGIAVDWVSGVREASAPESPVGNGNRTWFRGAEIAVVDPRAWEWGGAGGAGAGAQRSIQLVIGQREDRVALLIDATEGLVETPEIVQLPAWILPVAGRGFRGVTVQPDGVRLVVDPAALLSDARRLAERSAGEA